MKKLESKIYFGFAMVQIACAAISVSQGHWIDVIASVCFAAACILFSRHCIIVESNSVTLQKEVSKLLRENETLRAMTTHQEEQRLDS
jgi:hypothetical protein